MSLQGKRILLTTESLGPVNGVSRTTRSLIEYLQSQGADIVVVSPCSPASPASPHTPEQTPLLGEPLKPEYTLVGRPTTTGIKEIRIKGSPLPYNPDLTVVYPIHLHDLYQRAFPQTGRPDILYIASPASLGFQVLLQVRQTRNPPPVLVNFQTDLSAYATILLPSPLSHFAVWLLDSVQGYLFRHSSVRTIFYPSSPIETYLVHNTHTPRDRLQRLGRGVDTTLFHPSRRDESYRASIAPNGERILLCVCRLAPEKGFEFLARVVQSLLSRGQVQTGIKLLIVGGNRNPVVQKHIQGFFAASRLLQDAVIFTGFLGGEELARAYAIADVFVHCSVTETFGLVVLESMASGVPVVARAQGGPVDIIQHGRTGYLVSPGEDAGEVDGFVAQVEKVLCDPARREQLARTAREYALATTWDAINGRVARYISSLSEVEGGGGGGGGEEGEAPRRRSGMSVVKLVGSAMEVVRLRVAVAMVYAMWMIAVVPLLVHGLFYS